MLSTDVDPRRIRQIHKGEYKKGPILYWMNRDMRMQDNWALVFALQAARENEVPLLVCYNLVPTYLGGGLRQFDFKQKALTELHAAFKKKNIPLFVTVNKDTIQGIADIVEEYKISFVVTDFCPLRIAQEWLQDCIKKMPTVPLYEVDAHNVVPCKFVSDKQEYAAYTIRPKIKKQLRDFLTEFPAVKKQSINHGITPELPDWEKLKQAKELNQKITAVDWLEPGESGAHKMLAEFIKKRLIGYNENRNDPNQDALSDLSPFLHYGNIAAQRIALEINQADAPNEDKEAFLEELIIRKELADNFCLYNQQYDKVAAFHQWAQTTIAEHKDDEREYIYSLKEFEEAKTHDELWNAAQLQMVETGKMHGYMRMYWAKKILEWTPDHQTALDIAIYLNDTYELDGRDPNGYAGIAWSIGGIHDRAWNERPIFGKIRYMNFNGCKRKFKVDEYIATYNKQRTLV